MQTPGDADYWSLTYGRFAVSLLRGEFHAALEIAETYLRRAEVEERPDHVVNARRLLGTVKLELGAFLKSRQEFDKLLQDWDEDRDKDLRAVTGADVLCVGWSYMAQLMMILGEVDDAVRMSGGNSCANPLATSVRWLSRWVLVCSFSRCANATKPRCGGRRPLKPTLPKRVRG